MLSKLIIQNVALIGRAEIEFGNGLNVLSGETGSGKSVILDSINFVLGAKADKSMIRHGEEECSVWASFSVGQSSEALNALRDIGVDADEEIIIMRRFRADGRGDIKVNGCSVNASMLRKVTAHLVDVHGQSEHFFLLSEANQLRLIDRAAGPDLQKHKEKLSALLAEMWDIRAKLAALGGDESERGRRLDILRYQLDEIERADLREGEEEELIAKRTWYANLEKIMTALSEAAECMRGDGGACDSLRGARHAVADISSLDGAYASVEERLESALLEAEDIGDTLSSLSEDLVYDEEEAQEIEARLDVIKSLKKKYGASVENIFAYRDSVAEEYDLLSHCDEEFSRLNGRMEKLLDEVYRQCVLLSAERKKTAERFCARVEAELKTLNIRSAKFCAEFSEFTAEDAAHAAADGLDSMRFQFSANAGEPLKPMSKVISGGEMSRLMLAIKTCMSDVNGISTYIFDEIDAGISGETARTVAEKFARIARGTQIIAVSHLPQIAAMADESFLISKHETQDGKTLTEISPLCGDARFSEIVRLLGGSTQSGSADLLARELFESCARFKASLVG